MAFNFGFALGTKRSSQNSDNTGLFSKNVNTQKQSLLFGAPNDNAQNITFSSSLFGNDNKTSNENTPTNLFGAPMEQKDTKKENENTQNNLFFAPMKQKDTKKENENISTNLFPFGNQTNEKKSNFLFENPQNKNDTSQNKQDPVFKLPSSLFGNLADENNNKKPTTFSFLGFSQEKENEEKSKKDENEKNKNNQKEEKGGGIFNNIFSQKKEEKGLFAQFSSSTNKQELFINTNEKKIEIKNEEKEKKSGGIFSGIGLFDQTNEKNSLFTFTPSNKQNNNNEGEKEMKKLKKELFNINNEKQEQKEEKKEEDKKEEEKEDNKEDEKQISIIFKGEENQNLFGTPKKIKKEEKQNFEIPKIKKSPNIFDKKNDNTINLITGNNDNNNNLSSSKRIENSEEMQNALNNLYKSDVFLPYKTYEQPSLYDNKNINNKYKRCKQIDFFLIAEIEGITNINDEGFNMTSRADETMSNLMKNIKLLVKKKYKIYKESNDFDIYLLKNGKQLPINDRQLIGDIIKNKDKIIISIIHKSTKKIEEEEDENDDESKSEKNNFNKNQFCPKDKLPILTKPGYYMYPDEYKIARMSIEEINNVKNFSIYNENGRIIFDNPVSLYGINFDNLFNIEHDLIEYEKGMWYHSPRGKNFNIPATITLYNIHPNINISNINEKMKYEEFLKDKIHNNLNGTFLSYDFYTYQLKYKIPYFY